MLHKLITLTGQPFGSCLYLRLVHKDAQPDTRTTENRPMSCGKCNADSWVICDPIWRNPKDASNNGCSLTVKNRCICNLWAAIWWESLRLVAVDYSITSKEGIGKHFTAPGALRWVDTVPFMKFLYFSMIMLPYACRNKVRSNFYQDKDEVKGFLLASRVNICTHYWSFMGNLFSASLLLET